MTVEPVSVPGPLGVQDARALFDGELLRLARRMRGWSQGELAGRIGATAAAISQFEKGSSRPNTARLSALGEALGVPVGFFVPRADEGELARQAFFRSLRSTPMAARRKALAQALLVYWLTRALEQHVRLPEPDIPEYRLSLDEPLEKVEGVAQQVRADLGLGLEPIDNAVRTIERHGVVAAKLRTDDHTVDAFSIVVQRRPILMLTEDKEDRGRSRFDAAHELGHWVMHTETQVGAKEVENQAHRFAAAFLMPEAAIREQLPSKTDVRRFLTLKAHWGVSMSALLRRARDLDRMRHDEYERAMKQFSARGWRRREPGQLGAPEEPALLQRALEQAAQAGIDLRRLAAEADLPEADVRALVEASTDDRPDVAL